MRTAHVRFRGSRGGQPPRLPDSCEAGALTAAGSRSYVVVPELVDVGVTCRRSLARSWW